MTAKNSGLSVRRLASEVMGLGLLVIGLLSCLALATYSPADPVFALEPVANRAGVVGATLAGWLRGAAGHGSIVLVGAAAWLGARLVLQAGLPRLSSRFWVGNLLLLLAVSSTPPLLEGVAPGWLGALASDGGSLGGWIASREALLLSPWGALLLNGFAITIGLLSAVGISTAVALGACLSGLILAGSAVGSVAVVTGRVSVRGFAGAVTFAREGSSQAIRLLRETAAAFTVWREQRARRWRREAIRDSQAELSADPSAAAVSGDEGQPRARRSGAAEPHIVDHVAERKAQHEPSQEAFEFDEGSDSGPFALPELTIFEDPPEGARNYDRESLLMNSRILEKKLLDFGVTGKVVRVHPGPVITMYEYEPASGVKVGKIVNLTDDLAMALRALSIRIIAPLPGKSVVGIEVPNQEREIVHLRVLLESDTVRSLSGKLNVAMGKDIFGNAFAADLGRMPHLLVAGATGTGKSVFLNAFICSLLVRARPDELKLLLVDPKLLELSVYEDIPHLIADVVTSPKRAAAALAGIVRKMEERYQIMSACQVRNIDQFNAHAASEIKKGNTTFRLRTKPGEEEGKEVEYQHLPYIVVVIDELADLMVLAAKDVEESLQRLAQMARAAGIHLVLATQRPSVDVLTGVIKANFPARVAFQVASRIDSRTILDQGGAENLLGQGDMLFLPPGTSRLQRLHGAFVTETDVKGLVAYLRDQGRPHFDESLVRVTEDADKPVEPEEEIDEMFDRAVAVVAENRNASISYVQRRLRIGYNRAARIVEQMEMQGMVGPQNGTRPREIFLRASNEDESI